MDFLTAIEQSGAMAWVRESGSLLGYPTILFLHTIGLAVVAGLSAGLNLRLLGFAPRVPLSSLSGSFRYIWAAFWVTAISGTVLLATDATTKLASVVFYVKMVFVGLALANLQLLKTRAFGNALLDTTPVPASIKLLSVTSLALWIAATTAGRLMAYLGPVSGLDKLK
jgi:hypothetical protein